MDWWNALTRWYVRTMAQGAVAEASPCVLRGQLLVRLHAAALIGLEVVALIGFNDPLFKIELDLVQNIPHGLHRC